MIMASCVLLPAEGTHNYDHTSSPLGEPVDPNGPWNRNAHKRTPRVMATLGSTYKKGSWIPCGPHSFKLQASCAHIRAFPILTDLEGSGGSLTLAGNTPQWSSCQTRGRRRRILPILYGAEQNLLTPASLGVSFNPQLCRG